MKKLIAFALVLLSGIGFASCTGSSLLDEITLSEYSSKESLATLSYLSSGFLSMETQTSNVQTTRLSLEEQAVLDDTQFEEINQYFSLLKTFIEEGPQALASVQEEVSDRPEYDNLLRLGVRDDEFLLYYNVDILSREITGIFVLDGVEYEIIATSTLDDFIDFEDEDDEDDMDTEDEFDTEDEETTTEETTTEEASTEEASTEEATTEEATTEEATTEEVSTEEASTDVASTDGETTTEYVDDSAGPSNTSESTTPLGMQLLDNDEDDDEDDDDDQEVKREMTLVAINGEDRIEITYEFKMEDDEQKTEFEINKMINGVESEIVVEIKIEEDEYKLEIEDGENTYEFSVENEGDEIEYEMEYSVNGEEGEITIIESSDELGNTVYTYEYEIEGEERRVEKEDALDDDDDEDDDEDDDDEDENDDDEDNDEESSII